VRLGWDEVVARPIGLDAVIGAVAQVGTTHVLKLEDAPERLVGSARNESPLIVGEVRYLGRGLKNGRDAIALRTFGLGPDTGADAEEERCDDSAVVLRGERCDAAPMGEAVNSDAEIAVDGSPRTEHGKRAAGSLPDDLRLVRPLAIVLRVVRHLRVHDEAADEAACPHLSQEHELRLNDAHARASEKHVERAWRGSGARSRCVALDLEGGARVARDKRRAATAVAITVASIERVHTGGVLAVGHTARLSQPGLGFAAVELRAAAGVCGIWTIAPPRPKGVAYEELGRAAGTARLRYDACE